MTRTAQQRGSSWRRPAQAALLGALALCAAGCPAPERPLRVGANVWPGYEPMFLARDLGLYPDRQIQLLDFSSSSEVVHAYRDGLLDVAAITADEALVAARGREGDRIVLVCDVSVGADALLARRDIASLAGLRGRRVGVDTAAVGAYLLARALERGGLALAEVEVVPLPFFRQERALADGLVDALVTFEPHRTRLLAGGARQLFDSGQIPGEIVDVLLARGGLDPAQERALAALVAGWFRARDHLTTHPADVAARLGRREGLEPAAFLASLRGLELPDRDANLRMLEPSPSDLHPVLARLSSLLVRARIEPKHLPPPTLDPSFVRRAPR